MKTIGIIGGMSPESTVLYYQGINQGINQKLGGNYSAKIVMSSINFEEIVQLQKTQQWQQAGHLLAKEAQALQNYGCDFIILATNTMHKVAADIETAVQIPLLHIIDATAQKIQSKQLSKVGLLGTKFTMSDGFYHQRMQKYLIELITPPVSKQEEVNRIIFEELCLNHITPNAKKYYVQIIQAMIKNHQIQGIILGCTEIGLLIKQEDIDIPILDSTLIHVETTIETALTL